MRIRTACDKLAEAERSSRRWIDAHRHRASHLPSYVASFDLYLDLIRQRLAERPADQAACRHMLVKLDRMSYEIRARMR